MSSRRFNFVTVSFGLSVILLHLILIYTIVHYFYEVRSEINDQLLFKKLKIKKLIEEGRLEVESVASVFDREDGWRIFTRKKPSFPALTTRVVSTMAPATTREKVYRLTQDDDEVEEEEGDRYRPKLAEKGEETTAAGSGSAEGDYIYIDESTPQPPTRASPRISSNAISNTERPATSEDGEDVDSDEYAEIDDREQEDEQEEEEEWMTIELTTPLAVSAKNRSSTAYFVGAEGESEKENTSADSTTRPSTTTSTTTSTSRPISSTQKHPDENLTKLPSIHITQDLLRRIQPQQVPQGHQHKHRHHPSHHFETLNTTLVTALLDIGRGQWHSYGRSMHRYHTYMEQVLRLRVPLVAFVDSHSFEFVVEARRKFNLSHVTRVYLVGLNDFPLSRHLDVMKAIIQHELHGQGWQRGWDDGMRTHPEAKSAEYDLVVNSKPYFVFNASIDNPFNTHYFAWVDAGYGQGKADYFPRDYSWSPHFPAGKISVAKVTPYYDDIRRYTLKELYRQDRAVISGGFFGGDSEAVKALYHRYHAKVVELLFNQRVIDDDQTTFVLVMNEDPLLFNVLHADWFDAFKLFRRR